jgi:hypothetical protein
VWRFVIDHEDHPAPYVRRVSGVAYRKRVGVPFYLTISPVAILLSTTPGREGRKLIAHFTCILGEPTLRYRDKRGTYQDLTAEWHLIQNREAIMRRIVDHLALGFKPEEL